MKLPSHQERMTLIKVMLVAAASGLISYFLNKTMADLLGAKK